MSEQICDNCKKPNSADATYCYACGHILPAGMQAISTHNLNGNQHIKPQLRWGTAYFGDQTVLRIHVRHTGEVVEAKFETTCILGRAGDESQTVVDLTPYGAVEMGVSRRHVQLTRQEATVMVQDLESVNGTLLNGEKLLPNQPRVLRNEDELALGHLVLRISFTRISERALEAGYQPVLPLPEPNKISPTPRLGSVQAPSVEASPDEQTPPDQQP